MNMDNSPVDHGLPSDNGGKDLGVFLPMANGGWIMSKNRPPLDASYAYNREVAVLADEIGLDFVLSMAKWRGYGGETHHWDVSLDAQMLIAALADATKRVKVWTTVHTLLQNPAVTAKMIATIDQISGGRSGLNVVTGSYRGEFDQMGAWREDLDHDARYDFAAEWITAVKRLWSEPTVTMDGKFIKLDDCQSNPKPSRSPFLICAGTSPRGMSFTLDSMDAIFLTGRDNDDLGRTSRKAKAAAAERGRRLRTYTMMTLVIAETDEAAQAQAQSYRDGLDEGALQGMLRAYGFVDAERGKENAFIGAARSSFMTPRLIGSPESVGRQAIALLEQAELDGLMMIFPDYIKDMKVFAERTMPLIQSHFKLAGG
jgi:pyrimidine oxygenase